MSILRPTIASFARQASIEMLPSDIEKVDWNDPALQIKRDIYLPDRSKHPANSNIPRPKTIEAAKKLIEHGMTPVVHIAARRVPNLDTLKQLIAALVEAGVLKVLLVAGSAEPVGRYHTTRELIDTNLFDHFNSVSFAGHPQGNPYASAEEIEEALRWKNQYGAAMKSHQDVRLVTQFCNNASVLLEWAEQIRANGNKLPIDAGVTGPITLMELFNYARTCEMIGWKSPRLSAKFLLSQLDNIIDIRNKKGIYTAALNKLSEIVNDAQTNPLDPLIAGLHFYSFGKPEEILRYAHSLEFLQIEPSQGR